MGTVSAPHPSSQLGDFVLLKVVQQRQEWADSPTRAPQLPGVVPTRVGCKEEPCTPEVTLGSEPSSFLLSAYIPVSSSMVAWCVWFLGPAQHHRTQY